MSGKRKNEESRPRTAVVFHTLEPKQGKLVTSKRQKTRTPKPTVEVELADRDGSSRIGEAQIPIPGPSSSQGVLNEGRAADMPFSPLDQEDNFAPPIAEDAGTSTSSSAHLKDWNKRFVFAYLFRLFSLHSAPPSLVCNRCQQVSKKIYRCATCLVPSYQCSKCLIQSHSSTPTHSIKEWTGRFWTEASLSELGLVFSLGHGGSCCPSGGRVSDIWVGDLEGFSTVKVRFCYCVKSPEAPRGLQLIDIGIFPCSDHTPQSGFTIRLLRHFGIFSTLSKGSGHKYYAILERLTNTGFPGALPDRSRELRLTHRKFSFLLALKRAGTPYPAHPNPAYQDDLAIRCPACPNPGVNFSPEEVLAIEIMFMIFWLAYDGNFRNPRKAKKVDKDDICFTDGTMYYVKQDLYDQWIKSNTAQEPSQDKTRPECDNHKAAQDKYVRWGGLDVTGIGAYTCARHSLFLPRGVVDFRKGERFMYGDYGFGSVVNHLGQHGNLAFGMTYDIWCHWIKNFFDRASRLPPHVSLPEGLQLTSGIPKFHLQGHANVCWVRYSLNNMRHVGRIEGEGAERAWAHLNETSGSTSEKSPGARWDSINLIMGDWNYEKTIRMASFLCAKFAEAKRMLPKQRDVFNELHESLPEDLTDQWKTIPTDPVQLPSGKWSSPFQTTETTGEKLQEAVQREQDKEQESPSDPSKKSGVTKWLSVAIELEYAQELLRREVEKLGSNATPRQHNQINDRRKLLNERLASHRTRRDIYMGDVGTPDHSDRRQVVSPDPEHLELGLPSSYQLASLSKYSLLPMGEKEVELRRASCNDSIQAVKHLLGAKALALKYKHKEVRGERSTTRAELALREHQEKVSRVQWKYNNSRSALLRLSNEESDRKAYPLMRKDDLKLLTSYVENESASLGQGSKSIPWIWRSQTVGNEEEWQAEALRTEWFRARQRAQQWEEELRLLKREMVMTIRDFHVKAEIWDFKSKGEGMSSGMSEYASRKCDFYIRLKNNAVRQCLPLIKDPIVEFKWASDSISRLGLD